ncbi:unnamed protein product [Rotaria socialis]|uniref:Uncharacterized protein n=2 Tax=Rotaria socialis TaxID=392032 RepID=A0A817N0I4_9BILA|nr:unnamed protein product [Rotaria socialis]CAF4460959.1 unnamed protein product [Rotaria socialis]CAF4474466.1 unnamed protein product [Rotaria socialis]CAF4624943.1 unnamed protein product [Rotaria socialis]
MISNIDACDVMGARACGRKPEKEDRETDAIKYCVASRVYFECVHKKYRGCETKEKYETAMESIMKGIRKRVDDLLAFCNDKIEDYKFNIVWDSPKQAEAADSVRGGGGLHSIALSKNGILGSASVQQTPVVNEICQVKTINDLCQPLMITVKFNPSWNTVNKRGWCQQATTYFRCLKSRLDKCPQQEVQNQFQQVEHYLQSQININCPGGIDGCSRHSTDARCKIGLVQSNSSSSIVYLSYFFVQSVLQILLLLLLF